MQTALIWDNIYTSKTQNIPHDSQKRLSKGIFWYQNLEVEGDFLWVLSVENQRERMLEPRAVAQGQKTAYHANLRRLALAKKALRICVHPAVLQPLLPPSHIPPAMFHEFLISSPALQGIPRYIWCIKNIDSRRFLSLNHTSASYYFITLNKFLSTLCTLVSSSVNMEE